MEGWKSSIPEKGITVVVKDGKVTFDGNGFLTVTNTYEGPSTPTTPPVIPLDPPKPLPPDQNLENPDTPDTPAEPVEPSEKPLPDDKHTETEVPKTGDAGADSLLFNLLLLSISALAGTVFYLRRKMTDR